MEAKMQKQRKQASDGRRQGTVTPLPAPDPSPSGPFPLGLALLGLAFVLGLFSFLNSPYFHIAEVHVRGNDALASSELLERAGVYPGDNILHLDLRSVADRVASHPRVRHVHVERRLPDTVRIVVQEHVPVALLPVPEEGEDGPVDGGSVEEGDGPASFVAVNDALEQVPLLPDEWESLPVVAADEDKLLQAAVEASAHMPPSLRERVEIVEAAYDGGGVRIVARIRTGGVIVFGDEDELARKGAIAASLVHEDDFAVIDVRYPRSPVVRPR